MAIVDIGRPVVAIWGPPTSIPTTIKPMLARLRRHPFDSPDYLFELKWDGMRAVVFVDGTELKIQSRNLRNVTSQFPELAVIPNLVNARQAVLDGELVCFDDDGHPSLPLLLRRLQRQARGRIVLTPQVHFIAFDLLFLDGRSIMTEPLTSRKKLLKETLGSTENVMPCEYIENDGTAFYGATAKYGLEGIMAKERSSLYFPGKRSPSWHKVKRVRESDFVIGGYDFGGKRKELFSSLLLGLYDTNRELVYVGNVGTGFSDIEVKSLYSALQELHTGDRPFENTPRVEKFVYWCRPELACRVQYGEFTEDGKLRFPVYLSLMQDKPPTDCRIEDAPGWPSALPVG